MKRIIRDSFEGAGLPALFLSLLEIPLGQAGRAFFNDEPTQWEQFVRACATAANGKQTAAAVVAASFELCIAALDVFDEIEDGDDSALVDLVGTPRAINVGTALFAQSQTILADLVHVGDLPNPPSAFVDALNRSVVRATVGQDTDLQAGDDSGKSLEHALHIARNKSGNLVAGAATLGAMTGTSDPATLETYQEFGLRFGTMAQIANDIHDSNPGTGKSDTARGKSTLPRLFAARSSNVSVAEVDDEEVENSGGLHFSWVVFEIERRKCLRTLSELEAAGQNIEPLQLMVRA